MPLLLLLLLVLEVKALVFALVAAVADGMDVLVDDDDDDDGGTDTEVLDATKGDEEGKVELMGPSKETPLFSTSSLSGGGGASQLPRLPDAPTVLCSAFILIPPPKRPPLPLLVLLLLRVSDRARFTPGKPPVKSLLPAAGVAPFSPLSPIPPCSFAALSPTAFLSPPVVPAFAVADDAINFWLPVNEPSNVVLADNPLVLGTFASPRAAASPTSGALRLGVAASETSSFIESEDEDEDKEAAVASGTLLLSRGKVEASRLLGHATGSADESAAAGGDSCC